MARAHLYLSFIALLLYPLMSVADIPGPPDPEQACVWKKVGDSCHAQGDKWIDHGTCQMVGSKLLCSPKNEDVGNNKDEAPIIKGSDQIDDEKPVAAKEIAKSSDDSAFQAQGCSNVAGMQAGLVSLLSVLLGLFMALRIRKS